MGNGVEFVKNSFKTRAKVIEQLAARDEGFRDMCDDFQTAHDEKLQWERSSAPERGERIAEYQELMEILRTEIAQALESAAVVPFKPPRQ
jgi:acyl-CoA reductase-like NAD-dependent aldehyde dehydrogenase